MKKGIKILVFLISCFVIVILIGALKQSLKQAGEPAAIAWITIPLIAILYYIMFGHTKKNG